MREIHFMVCQNTVICSNKFIIDSKMIFPVKLWKLKKALSRMASRESMVGKSFQK